MQSSSPGLIQPVHIVQLTDCHLGDAPGDDLLGVDADESLASVVRLAKREQPAIDLVLGSGDLSNTGSAASYQRFLNAAQALPAPVLWLPGNHDDSATMRSSAFAQSLNLRRIELGSWQVIALDSSIPGRVEGQLGEAELTALEQCLAAHRQLHTLVVLHHHVLPVGCSWLDEQRVGDGEQLLSLLARFDHVRGLLSGHVHQEWDAMAGPIRVMTSPSTSIQFAPNSEDFGVDALGPGYRWLKLYPGGELETGVERIDAAAFPVDRQANGY